MKFIKSLFKITNPESKSTVHNFDAEGETKHEKEDHESFAQTMSTISRSYSTDTIDSVEENDKNFSVIENLADPSFKKTDSPPEYNIMEESSPVYNMSKDTPKEQSFKDKVIDTINNIKETVGQFFSDMGDAIYQQYQKINDYLFPSTEPKKNNDEGKIVKPDEFEKGSIDFGDIHKTISEDISEKQSKTESSQKEVSHTQRYLDSVKAREQDPPEKGRS